ncbi:hypothetical protein HK102_007448 [Quaeritorhiza haematococci]|nr:hypothetical protein HK102_007448 [Quaeritorhiza haematococci]
MLATLDREPPAPTAANPTLSASSLPPVSIPVTVRSLIGKRDDPLMHVYATQILNMVAEKRPTETRPLLLGLALKKRETTGEENGEDEDESERKTLHEILELLGEVGLW